MSNINWQKLTNVQQIDDIKKLSANQKVIIFKHSTRCPISSMALSGLERSWDASEHSETAIFFLDLIKHRDVSNAVADQFGVIHQSPQVIIIDKGEAVYDESHTAITYKELNDLVKA